MTLVPLKVRMPSKKRRYEIKKAWGTSPFARSHSRRPSHCPVNEKRTVAEAHADICKHSALHKLNTTGASTIVRTDNVRHNLQRRLPLPCFMLTRMKVAKFPQVKNKRQVNALYYVTATRLT